MKHLQNQNIDKQDFAVFLRDLSLSLNTNLKHMIEDSIHTNKKNENKKKSYHKGKKVVKKKDIIIQRQNEIREKQNYEDDTLKIPFMFKKLDRKCPFSDYNNLKTEKGKNDYKIQLLEYFCEDKKNTIHFIFSLYFSLKDKVTHEILEKVKSLLESYDYKLFMMKEMGDMLPPLDIWNRGEKKLEDWQIQTIDYVNKGESVIVKAPTSSGKSFIAMSAGIFHKKILYVCPAKPVVYQVGAHFNQMGLKVHFLVDNQCNYSYDSKTNIFIGTPQEIENNFMNIGVDFDYAVFDEIHNLNKTDDGDIYENILKMVKCNFLALSATIKNIETLRDYLSTIKKGKKIHYIEYNRRFITQQRWIWSNNKYHKLHPFSAYQNIDDLTLENSLPFTPNDCAVLWERMDDIFEDIYEDIDNESAYP